MEEEKIEKEGKIERKWITNYNQSWKLLVICVEYLRENDDAWKKGQEERKRENRKTEKS